MNEAFVGELNGEIGEEAFARIKSELDPGERLLWAGRPLSKPIVFGRGYLISGLLASVFFVLGFVFLRMTFRAGLAPDEKPVGLLIFMFFMAFIIVMGILISRRENYTQHSRTESSLYALTDRRAIAWLPVVKKQGVQVVSIHKGESLSLSRIDYPDGTGDVLFRSKVKGEYEEFDRNEFTGFEGVVNPRLVSEMCRRTLITGNQV